MNLTHTSVPDTSRRLERETAALSASRALRRDIVAGVRAPGERLRIPRLSAIYGFGATPLREALQRLAVDGLVCAEGNRGFHVAPLERETFRDLNVARTALEREALRLSLAAGDEAWEAAVVAAAWRMRRADRRLAEGDIEVEDWERANADFHGATVAACGSRWLLRLRRNLHEQCERYRRASLDRSARTRDLESEHAAIAEAVLERADELACERVTAHYEATERRLWSDET